MLVNSVLFFLVCRLTEHDMIYEVFSEFSLRKLQCCEKVFDPLIDFLVFCIVLTLTYLRSIKQILALDKDAASK